MTYSERIELTRAIVMLLDDWGIKPADQITLLALPRDTRPRTMRSYREHIPFPDDPSIYERIKHLIGIADALRTSYPLNARMGASWMSQANYRFEERTPLVVMLEDGLMGLIAVRVHLDCAFDWREDDAGS